MQPVAQAVSPFVGCWPPRRFGESGACRTPGAQRARMPLSSVSSAARLHLPPPVRASRSIGQIHVTDVPIDAA
ncbi:hypothetical protein ACVHYJ_11925 [Burkholderia pyrrocinia]